MRPISLATMRRKRSVCTKSTADRKRDWRKVFGHASGTCIFSSLSLPLKRQLFERGRGLGEQNQVERIVRPVGQRDLDRNHADFAHGFQRRAIDIRGRSLLHPGGEVADAQSLARSRRR